MAVSIPKVKVYIIEEVVFSWSFTWLYGYKMSYLYFCAQECNQNFLKERLEKV